MAVAEARQTILAGDIQSFSHIAADAKKQDRSKYNLLLQIVITEVTQGRDLMHIQYANDVCIRLVME